MKAVRALIRGSVGFLLVLAPFYNSVMAQDSLGMSQLAAVDYWDFVASWQVVGNYVYLSANQYGLRIMDLSDAAHPVEVGRQRWAPWCLQDVGIHIQDTMVYVSYFSPGTGSNGSILNISDPAHPVEVHRWNTVWDDPMDPTDPFIVFVQGNFAVGLQGVETLYPFLLDVSDWDNPVFAFDFYSHFPVSYPVGMVGDYLCMAGSGVILFDVSNPYAPVEVGSQSDPNASSADLCVNWVPEVCEAV
jgi:hypothetical protein